MIVLNQVLISLWNLNRLLSFRVVNVLTQYFLGCLNFLNQRPLKFVQSPSQINVMWDAVFKRFLCNAVLDYRSVLY